MFDHGRLLILVVGVYVSSLLARDVVAADAIGAESQATSGVAQAFRTDQEHPFLEVLRQYIRGCNRGDASLLQSTLAEDVTVYSLHIPPARGRQAVVKAWKEYHETTSTRWSIDDVVIEGNQAVMEWTALRGSDPAQAQFDRGIDWFVFKDGRISEIRQYGDPRGILRDGQTYEQMGFPYPERGYPTRDSIDSQLP